MEQQLLLLLDGLLYPSESDEPVQLLSQPRVLKGKVTTLDFAHLFGVEVGKRVVERDPEHFWSPVTYDQEWYGDEEMKRTARFLEIRQIFEQELTDIQYFETGEVEIGLYLLGHTEEKIIAIKSTAVRT